MEEVARLFEDADQHLSGGLRAPGSHPGSQDAGNDPIRASEAKAPAAPPIEEEELMSTTTEESDTVARADFGPPRWPGDTRPPFAPGNTAAERHGAWSERRVAPVAQELIDGLLEQAEADPQFAHLKTPVFRPALRAWARCEARIEVLASWLEDRTSGALPGDLDADDAVRPGAELLRRLEQQALRHRTQLAIDPASFARLRRDAGSALVSIDLAALIAGIDGAGSEGERDAGHGEGEADDA
jgi:hypothetical protein